LAYFSRLIKSKLPSEGELPDIVPINFNYSLLRTPLLFEVSVKITNQAKMLLAVQRLL